MLDQALGSALIILALWTRDNNLFKTNLCSNILMTRWAFFSIKYRYSGEHVWRFSTGK